MDTRSLEKQNRREQLLGMVLTRAYAQETNTAFAEQRGSYSDCYTASCPEVYQKGQGEGSVSYGSLEIQAEVAALETSKDHSTAEIRCGVKGILRRMRCVGRSGRGEEWRWGEERAKERQTQRESHVKERGG